MNQAPICRWCYEIFIYSNWLLPRRILLLLWAILFYIVSANDANWERMTRHNKLSPNTPLNIFSTILFFSLLFRSVFSSLFFRCCWALISLYILFCFRVFFSFVFGWMFVLVRIVFLFGAVICLAHTCGRAENVIWFPLIWSWVNRKMMMTGLKQTTTIERAQQWECTR